MTFGEAIRLTEQLASDPSSHVAAALLGWQHPYSREALVLADLFDLQHQKAWGGKGAKPKPYPRPWPDQQSGKRTSKPAADITQDEILAALRRAGHTAALPSPN